MKKIFIITFLTIFTFSCESTVPEKEAERAPGFLRTPDGDVAAYDANPESHYILDSLAWAYYKKKEYVKAAELMERVIDMVPGEAISLDHLGDIYFAMNRKREAIYFWRQARDLSEPEDEIADKIEEKLREYSAS